MKGAAARRLSQVQQPVIPVMGELIRQTPGTLSLGQGMVHWRPPATALEAAHISLAEGADAAAAVASTGPPLCALSLACNEPVTEAACCGAAAPPASCRGEATGASSCPLQPGQFVWPHGSGHVWTKRDSW